MPLRARSSYARAFWNRCSRFSLKVRRVRHIAVSSSSASAGNLVIQAGFRTDVWDGSVRAVDSLQLINFLRGGPPPTDRWQANFPLPVDRNIVTSTASTTAALFEWGSLWARSKQRWAIRPCSIICAANLSASCALAVVSATVAIRFSAISLIPLPLYSFNADWMYHLAPNAVRNGAAAASWPSATYRIPYLQYKKYDPVTNTAGRVPVVLVGANDGMLHAFDARATIHAADVGAGYAPGKGLLPMFRAASMPIWRR